MKDYKLDTVENVNSSLKEVFTKLAHSQSASSALLPPYAIPQLDAKDFISAEEKDKQSDHDDSDDRDEKKSVEKDERRVKVATRDRLRAAISELMTAYNPYFKKTNKEVLLLSLQQALKEYESLKKLKPTDSKQGSLEENPLLNDYRFLFSMQVFGDGWWVIPRDEDYKKIMRLFLAAAKRRNDVGNICLISLILDIEVEPEVRATMDKINLNIDTIKTASFLNANGIKLDEKEITRLKSLIEKLQQEIRSGGWSKHSKVKDALSDIGLGSKDYTPEQLLIAALTGRALADSDIANFLIEHGVKVKSEQAQVELLALTANKGLKEFSFALKLIPNVNAQDSDGNTALMQITKHDIKSLSSSQPSSNTPKITAFCILLDKGANPNIQNKNGDTALIVAASHHSCVDVNLILEREDVDTEARNSQGHTALLAAVIANIKRPKEDRGWMYEGVEETFQYFFELTLRALMEKGTKRKGADIDAKDSNGDTALLLAIKAKEKATLEILLNLGANPNVCDASGKSAVQWAIELDLTDVASNLEKCKSKKKKEDMKEKDEKKRDHSLDNPHDRFFTKGPDLANYIVSFLNPLEIHPKVRASKKFKGMIETSIRDDANDRLTHLITLLNDLNISVDRDKLPKKTDEAFKELIEKHKIAINKHILYIFNKGAKIQEDDVNQLIKRLSTLNIFIDRNTLEEVDKEKTKEVKKSDDKSDAKIDPDTAFHALFKKYGDKLNADTAADLLTDLRNQQIATPINLYCKGANCVEDRKSLESLLITAMNKNRLNVVSHLLQGGVCPLHQAVVSGNIELVRILLEHDANINVVDANGRTPLMLALDISSFSKHKDILVNMEITKLLIEKGAKIDIKDHSGETAITYAIKNKRGTLAMLLSEAKRTKTDAGLNTVNQHGQTPLLAIIQKCFEKNEENLFPMLYLTVLKPVFKHGVNVDAQDSKGCTALMLAVINKATDLAEYLLDQNANPCIPDAKGETPLSRAQANSQPEMVDLLKIQIRQYHLKNGIFTQDEAKQLDALLTKYTHQLEPVRIGSFNLPKLPMSEKKLKVKKAAIERLLSVPDKQTLLRIIQDLKSDPIISDPSSRKKNKRQLLEKIEARLVAEQKATHADTDKSSTATKGAASVKSMIFAKSDKSDSATQSSAASADHYREQKESKHTGKDQQDQQNITLADPTKASV